MRRNAFTLIELLVVIAIISILATLGFAGFGRVQRARDLVGCAEGMSRLRAALSAYAADYQDVFPCLDISGTREASTSIRSLIADAGYLSPLPFCPANDRLIKLWLKSNNKTAADISYFPMHMPYIELRTWKSAGFKLIKANPGMALAFCGSTNPTITTSKMYKGGVDLQTTSLPVPARVYPYELPAPQAPHGTPSPCDDLSVVSSRSSNWANTSLIGPLWSGVDPVSQRSNGAQMNVLLNGGSVVRLRVDYLSPNQEGYLPLSGAATLWSH